jgi:hypothetical protein
MRKISTLAAVALGIGVATVGLAGPAFAQSANTQQNAATSGGESGPVGGSGTTIQRQQPASVQSQVPASSNSQAQTDGRAQAGGGSR